MANTAESKNYSVELVSIANNVEIGEHRMLGETQNIRSHLAFLHIKNTSNESIDWWCQHNYFIGSDGFEYEPGQNITNNSCRPDTLPRHWYPKPTIHSGQEIRCIAEFPEPPEDTAIEKIIYEYENDYYEIEVEHDQLEEPPL